MREAPECGFYNCTHTHEPSCAVVRAVEEGRIAYSRYESYLKIMDEDGKYR
jgi:ribosome biogenesis GTPase